jgi:hypothetical protein
MSEPTLKAQQRSSIRAATTDHPVLFGTQPSEYRPQSVVRRAGC